jgi:hypothetical protein
MARTRKRIVVLSAAAVGLFLLWRIVDTQWLSNSRQDSAQDALAPQASTERPSPGVDTTLSVEASRERQGLEGPVSPAAQPDAMQAKTTPVGAGESWSRIENVSTALFNGTAKLEDVCALSRILLSRLDRNSAEKRPDGTIVYRIENDPALGSATLIVNPNRQGKSDQYELTVAKKTTSGYNGNSHDVDGSQLQIRFGNAGDGGDGMWDFNAHVEDKLRIGDDSVWSALSSAGTVPVGGALFRRGNDVYWQQDTARTAQMPDGKPAWRLGYGATKPVLIEKGGYSSEKVAEIQAALTGLGPQ